jgi:hypothetical protein
MVSIIVTWRNRKEISTAAESLIACATALAGELLIVNFGGNLDELREYLPSMPSATTRIVDVPQQQYFNKPKAANLGALHAQNSTLFFCDCDIILETSVFESLCREVRDNVGRFATFAGVRETALNSRGAGFVTRFGYELLIKTGSGREVRIFDHEEDANDGSRHAPGLLFVNKTDFLSVNGYNSGLDGWGWEDQDMICRLTLGAGLQRLQRGTVLHISHDERARIGAYPFADRWESRDKMFRRALASYDRGNFQGTFSEDTSEAEGITRVTAF